MTRVIFKDEGESNGVAFGPVHVLADGESTTVKVEAGEPREQPAWVTETEAERIAAEHGVGLERV